MIVDGFDIYSTSSLLVIALRFLFVDIDLTCSYPQQVDNNESIEGIMKAIELAPQ